MKVKLRLSEGAEMPKYATRGAAGADVKAHIMAHDRIVIMAGQRAIIPTGIYPEIPEGYELQVRPRSGLALHKGVTVLNSPGTIDSDYRGQIGVILHNSSDEDMEVKNGDRVAQLVFKEVEQAEFVEVDILSDTERGDGGYGSTGK